MNKETVKSTKQQEDLEELFPGLEGNHGLPKEIERPFTYAYNFFKENTIDLSKTAKHTPCVLDDGAIHTLSGDFANPDELYAYLRKQSAFKPDGITPELDDNHQPDGAMWYWVLSCEALTEVTGVVTLAYIDCEKDSDQVILKYRLEGDTYLEPDRVATVTFDLSKCPSCINDGGVDKSVLTDARPDLSVFVSGYPLHPAQAKALRLLLTNIEYVDCQSLFKDIQPYIKEAATCGLARKIDSGQRTLSDIDYHVWNIAEDCKELTTSLPTVKEILSTPKVELSWE